LADRLADGAPGSLQIRVSREGSRAVAELAGELDAATAPQLREEMLALVADGVRTLVLDMAGLALIDSTGLGVLVGVLKRVLQHGGELQLQAPRQAVRKVLDITGLDRIFTIVD
jgi:anti-sigma B factor antagonist